jgi:hypothetical protein
MAAETGSDHAASFRDPDILPIFSLDYQVKKSRLNSGHFNDDILNHLYFPGFRSAIKAALCMSTSYYRSGTL